MRKNWNNKCTVFFCPLFLTLSSLLLALCLILPETANSGPYLDSAHGNTSYGVDRSSLASFSYSKGNCAHCHEQHAMIGGAEPTPPAETGPSEYLLFGVLFTNQGDGFCFQCHIGTGSIQVSMPDQYNYSRIAGGDTNTCPDGIKEAFAFVDDTGNPQSNCSSSNGSSHFLEDIQDFLASKWEFGSDTENINPCSGCHNPHRAERDTHTTSGRTDGSANLIVSSVSRPSQHSKDNIEWELWGDETGERMNNYSSNYQAPYRTSATNYEPDGSSTTNGSNLVDYVTFCTDCHNTTNTITSTPLGGTLKTIDWGNEKHGQGNADGSICVQSPYNSTMGKVLSCLDCHEPHGAPSNVLIRQKVNGGTLGGFVTTIAAPAAECKPASTEGNKEIAYLCDRCHQDDKEIDSGCQEDHWFITHHDDSYACNSDSPYVANMCGDCHSPGMSFTPETPILMSDRTQKPIGEIKAGDKVLSFDFDNNTISESEVISVSNEFVNETLEINGVMTTSEHLFAAGRDQWVEAGELKTGDTILVLAGHQDGLEKIKLEKPVSSRHPEKVKVVDITLKGNENFFVIGKENKFLVHNMAEGPDCNSGRNTINCNCCHYHGSQRTDCDNTPATRRTF